MIVDSINNFEMYTFLNAKFNLVLDFLKQNDLNKIAVGKYAIEGDNIYVAVQDYQTKELKDGKLEAHKKYIDIQYVIEGEERIGYSDISKTIPQTDYNKEKDIIFLNGDAEFITANKDNFFIFYPQDAHMPSIATNIPSFVKKAVFKIQIDQII